jgi:DNA-directed RNA polymerase specialized sigma24 family protein
MGIRLSLLAELSMRSFCSGVLFLYFRLKAFVAKAAFREMTVEQLTSEFEQARPRLRSYILRITASVEDTEDILQDAFIKASQRIDAFRGESSVITWIFTIASNLAKDNLRARKRWAENVTDVCRAKALEDPGSDEPIVSWLTDQYGQWGSR